MGDRWRCAECLSTFPKSKLLEAHARLTKHKAYNCTKDSGCQKSFRVRTALIRHEASHATQKKHACKRCSKAFHRRDHCQDHESVCRGDLELDEPVTAGAEERIQRKESNPAYSLTEMRGQAHLASQTNRQDFNQTDPSNAMSEGSARLRNIVTDKSNERRDSYPLSGAANVKKHLLRVFDVERRSWKDYMMPDGLYHDAYSTGSSPARTMDTPEATPELVVNLKLMEPGPGLLRASQNSLNATSAPEVPTDACANTGFYMCTCHRCTYRVDSPATLQKDKRDFNGLRRRRNSASGCSTPKTNATGTPRAPNGSATIGPLQRNDGLGLENSPRTQRHPATFRCRICPKRYTRSASLREHLRAHVDERPFVCKVCAKTFVRHHDRRRHEALHSGEKKYPCKGTLESGSRWGCGKRFARADGLGRHFRSDAGRMCIKPLLDEDAAKRQRAWLLEHEHAPTAADSALGADAASMAQDMAENTLPAALLAQCPAPAEEDWCKVDPWLPTGIDHAGRSSLNVAMTRTISPMDSGTVMDGTPRSQSHGADDAVNQSKTSQGAGYLNDVQQASKHDYKNALVKEVIRLRGWPLGDNVVLPLFSMLYSPDQDVYIKRLEQEVLRLKLFT